MRKHRQRYYYKEIQRGMYTRKVNGKIIRLEKNHRKGHYLIDGQLCKCKPRRAIEVFEAYCDSFPHTAPTHLDMRRGRLFKQFLPNAYVNVISGRIGLSVMKLLPLDVPKSAGKSIREIAMSDNKLATVMLDEYLSKKESYDIYPPYVVKSYFYGIDFFNNTLPRVYLNNYR